MLGPKVLRANCLDASALVKIYTKEDGSDILEGYLKGEATRYATPICFYEALNVLKTKWLFRKTITKEEYMNASFKMAAWFSATQLNSDVNFLSPHTFKTVQEIAERHNLDLSDAFQIVSVKEGYFHPLIAESKTVLVTADKELAEAATKEGIKSWYILGQSPP
jgi:predicted nucleic acid-binding protein